MNGWFLLVSKNFIHLIYFSRKNLYKLYYNVQESMDKLII